MYFLANAYRLGPPEGKGLTPTETMVIVQIMSFKWGAQAPYPALRTIAERLGLSVRTVATRCGAWRSWALWSASTTANGGRSRYHFGGLVKRLEALMAADIAAKDAEHENLNQVDRLRTGEPQPS
jgi:hypothetical protein